MGRYCTAEQVAGRYRKVSDVRSYPAAVESWFIAFAEARLDSRLAETFTVPFSSNNVTAQDLAIDLTYQTIIQYDDTKKADLIEGSVNKRIDDLILGKAPMVLADGTTITSEGNDSWSNTEDYHSSFGMGDFETFCPDSAMVSAEQDARS